VYSSLSEGQFQLLRQTLLIFFQDMHIRVSLFLKNQIQNPSGRFVLTTSGPVPYGADVPGLIRTFDLRGREVSRSEFPPGGTYSSLVREGSFDLNGDRVLRLGRNLYRVEHPEETQTSRTSSVQVTGPELQIQTSCFNLVSKDPKCFGLNVCCSDLLSVTVGCLGFLFSGL
ncbi:Protein oscp1, partial [Xenotaenia resolanae]